MPHPRPGGRTRLAPALRGRRCSSARGWSHRAGWQPQESPRVWEGACLKRTRGPFPRHPARRGSGFAPPPRHAQMRGTRRALGMARSSPDRYDHARCSGQRTSRATSSSVTCEIPRCVVGISPHRSHVSPPLPETQSALMASSLAPSTDMQTPRSQDTAARVLPLALTPPRFPPPGSSLNGSSQSSSPAPVAIPLCHSSPPTQLRHDRKYRDVPSGNARGSPTVRGCQSNRWLGCLSGQGRGARRHKEIVELVLLFVGLGIEPEWERQAGNLVGRWPSRG